VLVFSGHEELHVGHRPALFVDVKYVTHQLSILVPCTTYFRPFCPDNPPYTSNKD
jgi:hypothetical protein